MASPASKSVECRYHGCGRPFTSKHRLREHVLEHLEVDPPKAIYQHAEIELRGDGGWTVIRNLATAEDQGEGSSKGAGANESDEVEGFRLKDILPTNSQAANITNTTTTSGGTTSQPISFSPVLPDKPSQLSYTSQTPLRPYHSQPTGSSLSRPHSSQAPGSEAAKRPFVHSAPPKSTPSPTTANRARVGAGAGVDHIASSPLMNRHSTGGSQPLPSSFRPDSQAISSTPHGQKR